jgi:capsular polysaccharide biosynthesis protein
LKLPPDNRLRTPPVTPWAISLLKPAFIGCNTLALNNSELENSGEKTSSGWSGWGLTGVIFSGVGGMLALLPHPFSKENPLLKLPPDNRLRTPPVTPWAISLLKPAFIGCNTLALNPAVNAPNIPCFKSPLLRR